MNSYSLAEDLHSHGCKVARKLQRKMEAFQVFCLPGKLETCGWELQHFSCQSVACNEGHIESSRSPLSLVDRNAIFVFLKVSDLLTM